MGALFKKKAATNGKAMFKKRSGSSESVAPTGTVIDKSLSVNGTITGNDPVTVMGRFEGDCKLGGNLEIGESAVVKGRLNAKAITIRGQVEGEVAGAQKVHMTATARMVGRMQTHKLSVTEGALFDGELQMTASDTSTKKPPRPPGHKPD